MKIRNIDDIYSLLVAISGKEAIRHTPASMLPIVAQGIACDLWLKGGADTGNTIELRNQLTNLNEKGVWDFYDKED